MDCLTIKAAQTILKRNLSALSLCLFRITSVISYQCKNVKMNGIIYTYTYYMTESASKRILVLSCNRRMFPNGLTFYINVKYDQVVC